MKSYISIITLTLALCISAKTEAQITLPYYQDFESVADTSYRPDQTTLVGLEGWSYSASNYDGSLGLGTIGGSGPKNLTTSVVLSTRGGTEYLNSSNWADLTLDLSAFLVAEDDILLDFVFTHNLAVSTDENKVFVRGNETSDWIVLYDWYANIKENYEWIDVSSLAISDSLAAYGQEYSATFQLRFGQQEIVDSNGLFAMDNIKVYNSPFSTEGRTGAINPSNGTVTYFGLGENATEIFNDFFTLDSEGFFRVKLADFPGVARESAVSFMIGDQVYVGSGEDAEGNYLSDFYRYDPETDSWTQIADFGGGARSRAVAFAIGNYGYVGTGLNATDEQSDFWKYDPENDTWTVMAGWGADKRQQAFAFVIDDQAYIGGGFYFDSFQFQLSDIQRYNPETETWTEKIFADGLNLAMNNADAFSLYGYGFIAYGSQDHLIKYNPITNEVENLGDYFGWGSSRSGLSSYVLGDSAYVGVGRSGSTYPTTFEIYYEENVTPTNLSISSNDINENEPVGTFIGVLNAEDEDEIYGLNYSLIVGNGENDEYNDSFYLSNDSLFTSQVLNFDGVAGTITARSVGIYLEVLDSRGGVSNSTLFIRIFDVNDAPDTLTLTNLTITENNENNVVVGELMGHDEDRSAFLTFAITSSDGITDADNAEFYINEGLLYTRTPDFEEKSLLRVNLSVQDSEGASLERSFEITVTDVNEAPSDILLALDDDIENRMVGTLSTLDEDAGDDTFTYLITSDESIFEVIENELWIKEGASAEIKELYEVSIETTDAGGLSFSKTYNLRGNEVLLDVESVSQAIKVYPNPFDDYLQIDTKALTKVEIYTLSGIRLISREGQGLGQSIDTSKLPVGMYILKAYTNTGFTDLKLIKE